MTTVITRQVTGEIAAGDAISPDIDQELNQHIISIVFYSDAGLTNPVGTGAMSGVVLVEVSETGEDYATIINGTIALGSPSYDRPNVGTQILKVRAQFLAVTGATHYKILVKSEDK